MKSRQRNNWEVLSIVGVSILLVFLGVLIADDYGSSWDEPGDREYARGVLSAYSANEIIYWEKYEERRLYGPAYFMFWTSVSDTLGNAVNHWNEHIAGHFLNFLTYIVGVLFFYVLARQFFKPLTSLILASLFLFQPVLFGHAFINQKDIPFMTAFMGAITFGVIFVNRIQNLDMEEEQTQISEGIRATIIRDWSRSQGYIKLAFFIGIAAAFVAISLVALSLLGATSTGDMILQFVGFHNNPLTIIARDILIFLNLDGGLINADQINFHYLRPLIIPSITLTFIVLILGYKIFINTVRALWIAYFRKSYLNRMSVPDWTYLILCGVMVGLALSIRILGPFASLLVITLIIWNFGLRLPIQMALILVVSKVVSYATWPFLWDNPIKHYIEAVMVAARHPWRGETLFEGILHSAESIPWYFLPKLLILQLSEPLILLLLLGTASVFRSRLISKKQNAIVGVLILWFVVPMVIPIFGKAIVYDNFRQFLFALPPLFIFVGFGLESIFRKLQLFRWKMLIGLIALFPGLLAIAQLHPYEYIYYNSLVGGVKRAQESYETDYWCTSYREATEIANLRLAPNARVAVWGPGSLVGYYARGDLEIFDLPALHETPNISAEAVILCPRSRAAENLFPDAVLIDQVDINGIGLASIKKLR